MPGLFFPQIPSTISKRYLYSVIFDLNIGKISDVLIQKNKIIHDYNAIVRLSELNPRSPNKKLIDFLQKKKKNPSNLKCGAQSELIVYNQSSKIKLPFYRLPEFDHLNLH